MQFVQKRKTLQWTAHSRMKMRFYHLSEARVKRVIHSPRRVEEGIAPNTIAMMQIAGSVRHPSEIWVMVAETKEKRRIISAWRYPGRTKEGRPLPEAVMQELREGVEAATEHA